MYVSLFWLAMIIIAASAVLGGVAYLTKRPKLKLRELRARLDIRVLAFGAIGFVIFIFPVSYFHEVGHALTCTLSGGTPKIDSPSIMGISQMCLHSLSNIELNRAMGGIFGAVGSLLALAFYPWYRHSTVYFGLLAACLAQACEEAPKAFVEPLHFDFYTTPEAATLFSVIQLASLAVFIVLLGGMVRKNVGPGAPLQQR